MNFLYTATRKFDPSINMNGQSWEGYLDWSGLRHLTEVISLDGILNQSLVEPDYDDPDDWNFLHVFGHHQTDLYTSLD